MVNVCSECGKNIIEGEKTYHCRHCEKDYCKNCVKYDYTQEGHIGMKAPICPGCTYITSVD